MAFDSDTGVIPELRASEQRVAKIKSEIDQFEQNFNRIANGYATDQYLNEDYHNLIISTRDLSAHLAQIQRAATAGAENSELRAKAHNLNGQAIAQLGRLRVLGTRVQQHIRGGSKQTAIKPSVDKLQSPFSQFTSAETQQSKQIQLQKDPVELQLDEQRAHEMERLESDIVQVNELFTTLATYVHEQSEMVDSIGQHVEVAYEKVEAGTKHLDSAVKHKRSARRKKCVCIIVAVVVIVILGLAIGLTVKQ